MNLVIVEVTMGCDCGITDLPLFTLLVELFVFAQLTETIMDRWKGIIINIYTFYLFTV
jgi:hypothetical protein